MGWQTDELGSAHEGFTVAVLRNGTDATADRPWWEYDGSTLPRAIAVRPACSCGWRSDTGEMYPIDFEDQDETEGGEHGDAAPYPYGAWMREHIGPLLGTTVPDELKDAIATVRKSLAALAASSRPLAAVAAAAQVEKLGAAALQRAVTAVRDGGGSWEDIGQALGTSRQAAHQRFAKAPFRG